MLSYCVYSGDEFRVILCTAKLRNLEIIPYQYTGEIGGLCLRLIWNDICIAFFSNSSPLYYFKLSGGKTAIDEVSHCELLSEQEMIEKIMELT